VDVAYGDTILDIPCSNMQSIQWRVSGCKLGKIALEKGWEIVGNTSTYG